MAVRQVYNAVTGKFNLVDDGSQYLPLAGGTMTGSIIGEQSASTPSTIKNSTSGNSKLTFFNLNPNAMDGQATSPGILTGFAYSIFTGFDVTSFYPVGTEVYVTGTQNGSNDGVHTLTAAHWDGTTNWYQWAGMVTEIGAPYGNLDFSFEGLEYSSYAPGADQEGGFFCTPASQKMFMRRGTYGQPGFYGGGISINDNTGGDLGGFFTYQAFPIIIAGIDWKIKQGITSSVILAGRQAEMKTSNAAYTEILALAHGYGTETLLQGTQTQDRLLTFPDKDGMIAVLSDIGGNPPVNTTNINTRADFIAAATTYVGGVITLPTGVYFIGDNIDLVGDRLTFDAASIVALISGSAKNNIIKSTGLVTSLISVSDSELAIRSLTLENRTGSLFNCVNIAKTTELIVTSSVMRNTLDLGILNGFHDMHFEDNHFSAFNAGFSTTGSLTHLHFTNNFVSQSRYSGTGNNTFLTFINSVSEMLDVNNNNFESAIAGNIAIDVSSGATFSSSALIQRNVFSNYTVTPLVGADANTLDWHIAPKTNIGLAGLFTGSRTIVNGSFSGGVTYPSFGELGETVPVETAVGFENNATKLRATVLVDIAYSINGAGDIFYFDLYNVTDGIAVVGSETPVAFSGLAVYPTYHVEESAEFILNADKSYRVRIARHTGTGSPITYLRAATLKIKAY